jgi:hypothetical protein
VFLSIAEGIEGMAPSEYGSSLKYNPARGARTIRMTNTTVHKGGSQAIEMASFEYVALLKSSKVNKLNLVNETVCARTKFICKILNSSGVAR